MQQQRQQRPQPQDINKQPELLQRFAAPPPCAPHPLFINIRQPQHIIQNFCKRFAEGGAAPLFLFRPNTYIGTCMSIEHIYMRPSRLKRYIQSNPVDTSTDWQYAESKKRVKLSLGKTLLADLEVDASAPLQVVAEQ